MADVLVRLGAGDAALKMKDGGDGSVAGVVAAGISSAAASGDKTVEIGNGVSKVRLRDMGDGTVATVVYGK